MFEMEAIINNSCFTTEFGNEIYSLNFAYDDIKDAVPLIDECASQARKRPEGSVQTLTIVEKGKFDPALVDKLKELTKGNSPYVKRAAVVGIEGLYKVVITAISIFNKRDFKLFDSKEEAIAYLLQDQIAHRMCIDNRTL